MNSKIELGRDTAERIQACLESHSYAESTRLAKELRALLSAKPSLIDLLTIHIGLLEWNRAQPSPPIMLAYEYAVAEQALKIMDKAHAAPVVERQPLNQCDGCRAGKPLENGKLHVMANAGGYRDVMSCTAHLYSSPPAPVAVEIDERAEFESAYACGAFYAAEQVEPIQFQDYRKHQAWVVWQARACLDKLKELNQ